MYRACVIPRSSFFGGGGGMRNLRQFKRLQRAPYFALTFLLRSQVIISPFLALVRILLEKSFSGLAVRNKDFT